MPIYNVGDAIYTVYGPAIVTGQVHYMDYQNVRRIMGYDCKFYPGTFDKFNNKLFISLDEIKFDGIKSK